MKFQIGDRVQASATAREQFPARRRWSGVVVGYGKKQRDMVRVRRDDTLRPETWHEMFWDKGDTCYEGDE